MGRILKSLSYERHSNQNLHEKKKIKKKINLIRPRGIYIFFFYWCLTELFYSRERSMDLENKRIAGWTFNELFPVFGKNVGRKLRRSVTHVLRQPEAAIYNMTQTEWTLNMYYYKNVGEKKIDVGACLELEVWLCNARSVIIALIFKLMIMRFSVRFVRSIILFST